MPPLAISAPPAFELSCNSVKPPSAPLTVAPLLILVALAAVPRRNLRETAPRPGDRSAVVDESERPRATMPPKNCVKPPSAPLTVAPLLVKITVPLATVPRKNCVKPPPAPLAVAPLLITVALAALPPEKSVKPPPAPLTVPPLLIKVPSAAVERTVVNRPQRR